MAIDFRVDYDCEAREALGNDGLLELTRARVAVNAMRGTGMHRGDRGLWTRLVRGAERDRVETTSAGQLRRTAARLVEFTTGCDGCPANITGRPAGCFGRVTYPIDGQTERRLAAGVAAIGAEAGVAPSCADAGAFIHAIGERAGEGERVRRMRRAARGGMRFFELREPVAVAAAGVTSDQIVERLFFATPEQGEGFHFRLPHAALRGHHAFFQVALDQCSAESTSTTLKELRVFAHAVAVAAELGVDLLVD